MASSHFLLVAILCLCTVCHANYQGRGWWLQQPYTEDDEFNIEAEYGHNYIVTCGNVTALEEMGDVTVHYWLLPDMNTIDQFNTSVEYFTIDGISAITWMGEGTQLNVSLIIENQFGFYYCHGDIDGKRFVEKRSINYKGPYFGDTWELYRMNTIVGCSAALAFAIIAGVSYFVYEWKFHEDDETSTDDQDVTPSTSKGTSSYGNGKSPVYDNQGFTGVDVVTKQPPPNYNQIEDTTAL